MNVVKGCGHSSPRGRCRGPRVRLPTRRSALSLFACFPTIPVLTTMRHPRRLNMRTIKVGNITETVVERADYPPERLKAVLGGETVAVLGYGVQGRGQSLNMKDNGVKVIVGQRPNTKSWDTATQDGWKPGETLFDLEEATKRGTIVQYLLSDAGQK